MHNPLEDFFNQAFGDHVHDYHGILEDRPECDTSKDWNSFFEFQEKWEDEQTL